MKFRFLFLSLLLVLAGCTSVKVGKRDMEISSPLFNYKSHTEDFSGSKETQAPVSAPSVK